MTVPQIVISSLMYGMIAITSSFYIYWWRADKCQYRNNGHRYRYYDLDFNVHGYAACKTHYIIGILGGFLWPLSILIFFGYVIASNLAER